MQSEESKKKQKRREGDIENCSSEACLPRFTLPSSILSIYDDTAQSRVMFFHPIRIDAFNSLHLTRSSYCMGMEGQSPASGFEI